MIAACAAAAAGGFQWESLGECLLPLHNRQLPAAALAAATAAEVAAAAGAAAVAAAAASAAGFLCFVRQTVRVEANWEACFP